MIRQSSSTVPPLKIGLQGGPQVVWHYLVQFLNWWWQEVTELFWRNSARSRSRCERVSLIISDNSVDLNFEGQSFEIGYRDFRQQQGLENLVSDIQDKLQGRTVSGLALSLPEIMEKTILLPEAVGTNLTEVIGYDIDRQTPFCREDVSYVCRVIERNLPGEKISVLLTLAPIAAMNHAYEIARMIGVELVYLGLTPTDPKSPNLLSSNKRNSGNFLLGSRGFLGLLLLSLSLLITPIVQKNHQINQLNSVFQDLQNTVPKQVAALDQVRDRLGWTRSPQLASRRYLDGLVDITQALAGEGWVHYLVWKPTAVEIRGRIPSTTEFVKRLATLSSIETVEYLSPTITLDRIPSVESEQEEFHLKLSYSPLVSQGGRDE